MQDLTLSTSKEPHGTTHEVPREVVSIDRCQLCGGSKFIPLDFTFAVSTKKAPRTGNERRIRWSLCTSCAFIFQNPRPTRRVQESQYADSAYRVRNGADAIEKEYINYAPYQFLRLQAWLSMNGIDLGAIRNGTCLDFGCGIGGALHRFAENNNKNYGVEIDRNLAAFGNKTFAIDIVHYLHELPSNLRYDLVIAHHSLEHVYDPGEFIAYASTHLKQDGVVVIAVPTWRNSSQLKSIAEYGDDDCDDNSMWDHISLANYLNRHGLFMTSALYQHYGSGGDWELIATAVKSNAQNCFTFSVDEILEELYCNLRPRSTAAKVHQPPDRMFAIKIEKR